MSKQNDDLFGDFLGVMLGAVALAIIVLGVVFSFILIPVGIAGFVGYRYYINWYNSPEQQERRSREHTQALYEKVRALRPPFPDRERFIEDICDEVQTSTDSVNRAMRSALGTLFDEEIFDGGVPPPPAVCDSSEGDAYRKFLSIQASLAARTDAPRIARHALISALRDYLSFLPRPALPGDLAFATPIRRSLGIREQGQCVNEIFGAVFAEEVVQANLFQALRDRIDRNGMALARELNPRNPTFVYPLDYDDDDLIERFLGGTAFKRLFDADVELAISQRDRFSHHHILAGSGHGKTQTLQYMIARDLEAVGRGEASIIVLDSQRQMIKNITRLACFGPGGALEGRLVLVDPTDIAYPVALSLFELPDSADPAEAERIRNASVSLLSYVLGGLLSAEMTSRQRTLFGFCIRACLVIPEATILTFAELLEDPSPFARYLDRLTPVAKKFFATQYDEPDFRRARGEVGRRLWSILENDTFVRMFSAPHSKLDLYDEMNAGKVILVDTAKGHLMEAAPMIGRFFIAMALQASQRRTSGRALPAFFYIDEAHEYFDDNVVEMLEQARKSSIGLILSHQYLGQLKGIREAVMANTAVKFAGGISHDDAMVLAKAMSTTTEAIRSEPPLSFAAQVKGGPAASITIPLKHMEKMERMSDVAWEAVRAEMRERYATVPKATTEPDEQPEAASEPSTEAEEPPPVSEAMTKDEDPPSVPDEPSADEPTEPEPLTPVSDAEPTKHQFRPSNSEDPPILDNKPSPGQKRPPPSKNSPDEIDL